MLKIILCIYYKDVFFVFMYVVVVSSHGEHDIGDGGNIKGIATSSHVE